MKTTLFPADLRENIIRQAKRLSNHVDLQLSPAKEVLAKALYRCAGWEDLCARLDSDKPGKHILLLASLPRSEEAKEYFRLHIEQLSRSLSQHMLTNANLIGLYETLRRVFSVSDKPVTLYDIAPTVLTSTWMSMGIGPDANAVISATANLNGVPIKLIGTRVYMPKYYQFGPKVTCPAEFAEPYCETVRIIWSNPQAWYDAAYRYLTSQDDDEEDTELLLPDEVLNDAMKDHQDWFSRMSDIWDMNFSYGEYGEDFIPFIIPELGCYLVFGIPAALATDSSRTMANSLILHSDADNDSSLVLVDGQPLCVEWISISSNTRKHEGQYPEHFNNLHRSVFSHPDCNLDLYQLNGWRNSYFFVRPATQFDIDQFVKVEFGPKPGKEAFVLKSDHPEIASIVFDKVATRDVMIYPSEFRENNYLIEVDVSRHEDLRTFSLSLDALGEGWWRGNNLVTSSIVDAKEFQKTLYIQIQPELLSLVDVIPKKTLKDAVHHGWIVHQPAGSNELLEQPPKRCRNLKPAPKELVDLFTRRLEGMNLSPFDLLLHAKRIRYKRDNF